MKNTPLSVTSGNFSVEEVKEALHKCITIAQSDVYAQELHQLKSKNKVSTVAKLSPFVDERGVIRVGGRIGRGEFDYNIKHPILLPPDHDVTRLIILDAHTNLKHPSTARLLSFLRSKYWIVRGRRTIEKITKRCFVCKIYRQTPKVPRMSDLPSSRITPCTPFNECGLNYFGPYYTNIFRRQVKRYIVLFTCMTTRAVHLEIADSYDTESFLMAFSRFENRRGRPKRVYSDNGTQIVAGQKAMTEGLERLSKEKIVNFMLQKQIDWVFSPPLAPHFGGVWESLVKSAKRAIEVILQSRPMNEEILKTVIVQVEGLLIGRPLTHISIDPRDEEPLTPNHFLIGRAECQTQGDVFEEGDKLSKKHWRAAQVLVNHFWRRWVKEYLPNLMERKKWRKDHKNLEKGDIVLIADANQPRGNWLYGPVDQIIESADGVVRSAIIKTRQGTLHRPVAKLCLIERENEA